MSALSYSVGLNTSKFSSGLQIMRGGVSGLTGMMGTLSKTVLPFGSLIAGAGGLAGAFALLKKSSNLAADFESTAVALRTLIGDVDATNKVLEQTKALASQTPFEFPELANAVKMSIAFGESSKTVVDTIRRLGDVASGVQMPIGEIAELYGKARVQGTLFAEDINQMTGRGIPIISALAKVIGTTDDQVKKLASEGKITFPLLEQAFINITSEGGKFYNMMAEQSKTFSGKVSTMGDAWKALLRTIGEPINDWLKPQIEGWTASLESAGVRLSAFLKLMAAAQGQGKLMEFLGDGLQVAIGEGINTFVAGIRGSVAFLGATLPGIFRAASMAIVDSGFLIVIKEAFFGIGELLSAKILSALSNVPGMGNLKDVADAGQRNADQSFDLLPRLLEGMRMDKGLESAGAAIKKSFEDGAAAWKNAQGGKLIDTTAAKNRMAGIGKAIDAKSWQEIVTGQSLAPKVAEEAKKKVEGLEGAIKKAGETSEKAKTAIKAKAAAQEEGERRPLRSIFMKKLRDGAGGGFVPGPDGFFVPAPMIANKGRNAFGQNRAARPNADKREPMVDPLLRAVQKLDSIDKRLAALGLA
jgi:tape measure domain-containing protein